MANLYKELAEVYEAMYHTFIDYEAEYACYGSILKKHNKKNVLEIGCGTGNLAPLFERDGFVYKGLDNSEEMIALAAVKYPSCRFLKGDMRQFNLEKKVDSCLITARTIAYLVTNTDLQKAFYSIRSNMETGGILSFDFIDANRFIPPIVSPKVILHEAHFKGIDYRRESTWTAALQESMNFQWDATYYKKQGDTLTFIAEDNSTIRSFMKDEIQLFLEINGFEILEFIDRATYAFPTFVAVAKAR